MNSNKEQIVATFATMNENDQKGLLQNLVKVHADTVSKAAISNILGGIQATSPSQTRTTENTSNETVKKAASTAPKRRRGRSSRQEPREIPGLGTVSNMREVAVALTNSRGEVKIADAIDFVQQHIDLMPIDTKKPEKIKTAVRNAFAYASNDKNKQIGHKGTGLYTKIASGNKQEAQNNHAVGASA